MLLSRFWYVLLGLAVGALTFVLFLAQSMYNRAGARAVAEALSADNQVVSWYMKNDARERSAQLIKFALNGDIAKSLADSSKSENGVPEKDRDPVKAGLNAVIAQIAKDDQFDAVFAVDQYGRVVGHTGYEQAQGNEDFELGGYPVVADALHGYVRADTLLLDRMYIVVARPVEYDLGQMPAGAIVGARIIDDRFARELSQRTGAAVGFFIGDHRVGGGAPEEIDKSQLDQVVGELGSLKEDAEFKEKGVSNVHKIGGGALAVVYSRIPGETWQLDVGLAVARKATEIGSIADFFKLADDKDKQNGHTTLVGLIAFGALAIGLIFSVLEHTLPVRSFKRQVRRFAKSEVDHLQPSGFRGVFRQITSDLNDGIDHAVAKGGGSRRAADLHQVFGEIPQQPQMSAFNLPGAESVGPITMAEPLSAMPGSVQGNPLPVPQRRAALDRSAPQTERQQGHQEPSVNVSVTPVSEIDGEWQHVYEEFLRTKQACGERTDGLSFEKFLHTLTKNRDAMMQRHGVKRVKFSVYVKEGRAALKVSPVRD